MLFVCVLHNLLVDKNNIYLLNDAHYTFLLTVISSMKYFSDSL